MPSIVALIPARAGSKRVPGKNMRLLGGKPLIAYTAEAAIQSGIFADIWVVTDDIGMAALALWPAYQAVRILARSDQSATDDAPDILWVREALAHSRPPVDAFAILRPTSPFRTADDIRHAWQEFQLAQPCDSLRAVQPVTEHPGKMWAMLTDGSMRPLWDWAIGETPYHSRPTQTLPRYYVQNAGLEIAWTRVVRETGTISGMRIVPFVCPLLDINTEADWQEAERILAASQTPA